MACSTCHVILDDNVYDSLEPACDDEEDMLDMAFGLTHTYMFIISNLYTGDHETLLTGNGDLLDRSSRLGCQVFVDENMEGTTVCSSGS